MKKKDLTNLSARLVRAGFHVKHTGLETSKVAETRVWVDETNIGARSIVYRTCKVDGVKHESLEVIQHGIESPASAVEFLTEAGIFTDLEALKDGSRLRIAETTLKRIADMQTSKDSFTDGIDKAVKLAKACLKLLRGGAKK